MSIRSCLKQKCCRLAGILAIVLACLPAYVSAYTVAGPSEAPTLLLGDRVIVNHAAYDLKLPYSSIRLASLGTPHRGDLVAFRVPNRNLIMGLKRVVALAGDTLEMRENQLFINGRQALYETLPRADFDSIPPAHEIGTIVAVEMASSALYQVTYTPGLSPIRSFGPLIVPPNSLFVLGDHRDNSNDSRAFGPLPRHMVEGKVVSIMASH